MNEERKDWTIGELPTRGPYGLPLPDSEPRATVGEYGGKRGWDPSQTIGELETLRPENAGLLMLAGRYRAVKPLGKGGMGSVWLAEDTKLDNRKVAVKMLPAVLAGKKAACRQVKQEALLAMKLAHPNIATVRAFEEDEGGAPFLVMDYVEGTGLDEILGEKGKLSEAETVKLLAPVAAALDYAHAKGVVHRDVKPGNVMVAKDGTPFVLDFGIAREIQETMTRVTGKFSSGTLLYMSPEQLNGRAPKAAQDVYSFAAMAYECLSGAPPFARGQIEWQIVNNPPEPLPEGVASKALREGIMAGLAKEPEKRPGTCMGVLATGGASRPGEPVAGTPAGATAGKSSGKVAGNAVGRAARPESSPHQQGAGEAERAVRVAEARAEAERKARREAEEEAREARRRAQAEELAAQQAEAARGRAAGWAWFLAILLVVGGLAAYGRWQQEHETSRAQVRSLQQEAEAQRKAQAEAEAKWKAAAEAQRRAQEEAERKAAEAEAQRKAQQEADAQRKAAEEAERKVRRGAWDGTYRGEARDVSLPEGKMMRLHWCPEGSFTMGSPATEEGRDNDEVQHEVTLTRGFWMAETEVTQGQWKALMNGETVADLARKALQDDTGYDFNDGKGAITMRERWGMKRGDDPMGRCGDLDDAVPVYNVSWGEAREFCRRLTEKGRNEGWLPAGYSFRLPTEAEWEYACRAGTKTALPNGQDIRILGDNNAPALDAIAWYGGNSSVGFEGDRAVDTSTWPDKQYPGGRAFARKVGLKAANGWGLRDMIGNVWEWCEDESAGYPARPVTDYCKSNSITALGVHRIVRGGSWNFVARLCRSANRNCYPAGCRNNDVGFRPVCSAGTVQ